MHYGYIGLGNLGGHCAACLIRAGFQVTVFDLNPVLAERLVAMGARLANSRVWPGWKPSSEFGPLRARTKAARK